MKLLTVPGYTGSGPRHWHSIWEQAEPSIARIEQQDWDNPDSETWSAAIDAAVWTVDQPVVLVAHSCGSTAVTHWAARHGTRIAGAFLVAPPDTDRTDLAEPVMRFALAMPALMRLPFPSWLVASEDDPHCTFERAGYLAGAWGATLVSAGQAGHINTASGHGPWPEGRRLLEQFCADLGATRASGV